MFALQEDIFAWEGLEIPISVPKARNEPLPPEHLTFAFLRDGKVGEGLEIPVRKCHLQGVPRVPSLLQACGRGFLFPEIQECIQA